MTDQDLELRLRAWYGAAVPVSETAPPALRSSVLGIPRTAPHPLLRLDGRRPLVMVAAAGLVALAAAGVVLVGALSLPTVAPLPTPTAVPTKATASEPPSATALPHPPIAGMSADWRQVFAASDSVAWVATTSTVYRTDDLGATWSDATPPTFDGQFWTLTVVDADTAFAAPGQPSAMIYATHDGGVTWSPSVVAAGVLYGPPSLSFSTATTGRATFFTQADGSLAQPGSLGVYATSDGGSSWVPTGSGAIPQLTGGIPKLQGPDGGYLWHSAGKTDGQAFNNRFFLSDDGGVNWSAYTFPISAISPRDELKEIAGIVREADGHFLIAIQAAVSDHDLAIYESTDNPAAWRLAYQVPGTGSSVQFLSPTTWILASPDAVRTTLDAGATWTTLTPDPSPTFWHVHFATTRTGWARVGGTGDPQQLFVSTDGGATWRRVGT